MKLSRNKINKLLKINNQSRKNRHHIKNKAKSLHTFSDDELILTGDKAFSTKAKTMHARPRPLNLRFKTLKNKRADKKYEQPQKGGSATIEEAWKNVNSTPVTDANKASIVDDAKALKEIIGEIKISDVKETDDQIKVNLSSISENKFGDGDDNNRLTVDVLPETLKGLADKFNEYKKTHPDIPPRGDKEGEGTSEKETSAEIKTDVPGEKPGDVPVTNKPGAKITIYFITKNKDDNGAPIKMALPIDDTSTVKDVGAFKTLFATLKTNAENSYLNAEDANEPIYTPETDKVTINGRVFLDPSMTNDGDMIEQKLIKLNLGKDLQNNMTFVITSDMIKITFGGLVDSPPEAKPYSFNMTIDAILKKDENQKVKEKLEAGTTVTTDKKTIVKNYIVDEKNNVLNPTFTLKQCKFTNDTTLYVRSALYIFFHRLLYGDLYYMIDVQYIRNIFSYLDSDPSYSDLIQLKPFPHKVDPNSEINNVWDDESLMGGAELIERTKLIRRRDKKSKALTSTADGGGQLESGKFFTSPAERDDDTKYVGFPVPEFTPKQVTASTDNFIKALLGSVADQDTFFKNLLGTSTVGIMSNINKNIVEFIGRIRKGTARVLSDTEKLNIERKKNEDQRKSFTQNFNLWQQQLNQLVLEKKDLSEASKAKIQTYVQKLEDSRKKTQERDEFMERKEKEYADNLRKYRAEITSLEQIQKSLGDRNDRNEKTLKELKSKGEAKSAEDEAKIAQLEKENADSNAQLQAEIKKVQDLNNKIKDPEFLEELNRNKADADALQETLEQMQKDAELVEIRANFPKPPEPVDYKPAIASTKALYESVGEVDDLYEKIDEGEDIYATIPGEEDENIYGDAGELGDPVVETGDSTQYQADVEEKAALQKRLNPGSRPGYETPTRGNPESEPIYENLNGPPPLETQSEAAAALEKRGGGRSSSPPPSSPILVFLDFDQTIIPANSMFINPINQGTDISKQRILDKMSELGQLKKEGKAYGKEVHLFIITGSMQENIDENKNKILDPATIAIFKASGILGFPTSKIPRDGKYEALVADNKRKQIKHLIREYDADPVDCLFFDDNKQNIDIVKEKFTGINVFHVKKGNLKASNNGGSQYEYEATIDKIMEETKALIHDEQSGGLFTRSGFTASKRAANAFIELLKDTGTPIAKIENEYSSLFVRYNEGNKVGNNMADLLFKEFKEGKNKERIRMIGELNKGKETEAPKFFALVNVINSDDNTIKGQLDTEIKNASDKARIVKDMKKGVKGKWYTSGDLSKREQDILEYKLKTPTEKINQIQKWIDANRTDAKKVGQYQRALAYYKAKYGNEQGDVLELDENGALYSIKIYTEQDKHLEALKEAQKFWRNFILGSKKKSVELSGTGEDDENKLDTSLPESPVADIKKSPEDLVQGQDDTTINDKLTKLFKMKYYLNFIAFVFLDAQTASESVGLFENKNILKKINAYYQNVNAGDFSASFNTWKADGYVKRFLTQLRINFKIKEISPSNVNKMPEYKTDMAGMTKAYSYNHMEMYLSSGNRKNETLYKIGKLISHGEYVKQQMKMMEKFLSMIRCKQFTSNGGIKYLNDEAITDKKLTNKLIYANHATIYNAFKTTYANQSINSMYSRLSSTSGANPSENILKNFFNYEDTDKITGAKVKGIDLIKNMVGTATQSLIPLAQAYKASLLSDRAALESGQKLKEAAALAAKQSAAVSAAEEILDLAKQIVDITLPAGASVNADGKPVLKLGESGASNDATTTGGPKLSQQAIEEGEKRGTPENQAKTEAALKEKQAGLDKEKAADEAIAKAKKEEDDKKAAAAEAEKAKNAKPGDLTVVPGKTGEGEGVEGAGSDLGGGGQSDVATTVDIQGKSDEIKKLLAENIKPVLDPKNFQLRSAIRDVESANDKVVKANLTSKDLYAKAKILRDMIVALYEKKGPSSSSIVSGAVSGLIPGAISPGDLADLYAKLAALEGRIKGQEEEADKKKMREDVAAIQAIMNGEDALSHKIKFLVDIPKWQQFKVIGSTDSSFEETAQKLASDLINNQVKGLENKSAEIKEVDKHLDEGLDKTIAEFKAETDPTKKALLKSILLKLSSEFVDALLKGSRDQTKIDDKEKIIVDTANKQGQPLIISNPAAEKEKAIQAAKGAIEILQKSVNLGVTKDNIKANGEKLKAAAEALEKLTPNIDQEFATNLLDSANKIVKGSGSTTISEIPASTDKNEIVKKAKDIASGIQGLTGGGDNTKPMVGGDPISDALGSIEDLLTAFTGDDKNKSKRDNLKNKIDEATKLLPAEAKDDNTPIMKGLRTEINAANAILISTPESGTAEADVKPPGDANKDVPAPKADAAPPGGPAPEKAPEKAPETPETGSKEKAPEEKATPETPGGPATPAGATGATGGPETGGPETGGPETGGPETGGPEKGSDAPPEKAGENAPEKKDENPAPPEKAPATPEPAASGAERGGSKRSRHNKKGRKSTRTKRRHGKKGKKMTKRK